MYVKPTRCAVVALCIGIGLLTAGNAFGQFLPGGGVNTSDPGLPPDSGAYLTPADVHAMYHGPGLAVVLSKAQHKPFSQDAHRSGGTAGGDEFEQFNSELNAMVSFNGSPDQPIMMTGPVSVLSHGKAGMTTGTFDTEMLQLDLSGGGAMIRESPTLASMGKTMITDIGGGMFHIDSFFDVFTELSVDGGQTWNPSDTSTRVDLSPEPSSLVLFGLGALACLRLVLRRRKK